MTLFLEKTSIYTRNLKVFKQALINLIAERDDQQILNLQLSSLSQKSTLNSAWSTTCRTWTRLTTTCSLGITRNYPSTGVKMLILK